MEPITLCKKTFNYFLILLLTVFNVSACNEDKDPVDGNNDPEIITRTKTASTISELRGMLYAAKPGDTLQVSGTLDVPNGAIETTKAGKPNEYIVIQGINNAKLNFTGAAEAACLKISHDYYKVSDLVIDANAHSKRGLLIQGAKHGMVLNVEVRNTLNEAFKIRKNSQYWYFERCGVISSGLEGQYGEGFYCGDAFANWTTGNNPDTTGYITFNHCYVNRSHADGFDFKEGTHHIKVLNCTVDFENIEVDPTYGNSGVFSRANYVQVVNCVMKNNSKGDRSCFFFQRKKAKDGVFYGISSEMKNVEVENFKNYVYWTDQPDTKLYNDYSNTQTAGMKQPDSPQSALETDAADFVQMTWDGEGGGVY
jgi:hypothetical protein